MMNDNDYLIKLNNHNGFLYNESTAKNGYLINSTFDEPTYLTFKVDFIMPKQYGFNFTPEPYKEMNKKQNERIEKIKNKKDFKNIKNPNHFKCFSKRQKLYIPFFKKC